MKEGHFLELPTPRKGKELSGETVGLIKDFYQDDEYSRQLPGQKDIVSIKRHTYEQKHLILCNLKELYSSFKCKYPLFNIGFSKFCTLHPKWCVLAGASGTHSVCVCIIHQNVQLLLSATHFQESYHDLLAKMVCSIESRNCMLKVCPKCPGINSLKMYLQSKFEDSDLDDTILYIQWVSTDCTNLVHHMSTIAEYIDLLAEKLNSLTSHSYISKKQAQYLKERKETLEDTTCIVLMDFSENYSFVIQDEVQGYHWNTGHCTLHPIVI